MANISSRCFAHRPRPTIVDARGRRGRTTGTRVRRPRTGRRGSRRSRPRWSRRPRRGRDPATEDDRGAERRQQERGDGIFTRRGDNRADRREREDDATAMAAGLLALRRTTCRQRYWPAVTTREMQVVAKRGTAPMASTSVAACEDGAGEPTGHRRTRTPRRRHDRRRVGRDRRLERRRSTPRAILDSVTLETRRLLLDLSGVEYFDSVGVRLSFDLEQRLPGSGSTFGIVRPAALLRAQGARAVRRRARARDVRRSRRRARQLLTPRTASGGRHERRAPGRAGRRRRSRAVSCRRRSRCSAR